MVKALKIIMLNQAEDREVDEVGETVRAVFRILPCLIRPVAIICALFPNPQDTREKLVTGQLMPTNP